MAADAQPGDPVKRPRMEVAAKPRPTEEEILTGWDPSPHSGGQRKAIRAVAKGWNVFLTGPGGTGKSFVIAMIMKQYRRAGLRVALTATTGTAAVNLGEEATTIHQFSCMGLYSRQIHKIIERIRKNTAAMERIQGTDLLIIDEVSMLQDQQLTALNVAFQHVRGSTRPFGGIQVLLVGDFFQLPPVSGRYVFHSAAWKDANLLCVELRRVFRQATSTRYELTGDTFADTLNRIRRGDHTPADIALLSTRVCAPLVVPKGYIPPYLVPMSADADSINVRMLSAQGKPVKIFGATICKDIAGNLPLDLKSVNDAYMSNAVLQLNKSMPVRYRTELCIGAQVILRVNLDIKKSLVNGSVGKVVGFDTLACAEGCITFKKGNYTRYVEGGLHPVVDFAPPKGQTEPRRVLVPQYRWTKRVDIDGCYSFVNMWQVPLLLGWAQTIHKAQGMSLPWCVVQLKRSFSPGQAYVALSRVTSLEGLSIWEAFAEDVIQVDREVKDWYCTHVWSKKQTSSKKTESTGK